MKRLNNISPSIFTSPLGFITDASWWSVRQSFTDQCTSGISITISSPTIALRFARLAIRHLCGFDAKAPISGQRAMRTEVLWATLPFARGYGMEVGMTVDAVRAGYRVGEYELDLSHRATGRTLGGFLHRGRQLRDFSRAYRARRRRG